MDIAALASKAALQSPQGCGAVHLSPGLTLYVDGDGLAYYCAGNDSTSSGTARANLIDKVKSAQRVTGAENVRILLTGSGSTKGDRYAIARVKPYQGQRANSRRPKSWQTLRDLMEGGDVGGFPVEITYTAEADDLFGKHVYKAPAKSVIYTQDKDMRMLPGYHLDWVSHTTCFVELRLWNHTAYDVVHGDKQYGLKWFWLQMLHGDTADNIPGLPYYRDASDKLKRVGEVTAGKLLDAAENGYAEAVRSAYATYYGERALVEMMEQACLLWMRRDPEAWDDCLSPDGPLALWNDGSQEFCAAYLEIQDRVRDARKYNTPQDNAGSTDTATATD